MGALIEVEERAAFDIEAAEKHYQSKFIPHNMIYN